MKSNPFTFSVTLPGGAPSEYDNHFERRLSSMREQYSDQVSVAAMLAQNDVPVYEVYEIRRPEVPGELLHVRDIPHVVSVYNAVFREVKFPEYFEREHLAAFYRIPYIKEKLLIVLG